jgi:hypothetical protein
MALNAYIGDVYDLLHDQGGQFFSLAKIVRYVNQARQKIAQDTQCIRILTPSASPVLTLAIVNGGSNYTAPTLTIDPPTGNAYNAIQATATATVSGGVITGYTLTNPGAGYITSPSVAITDATGSGGVITSAINPVLYTIAGQETYAVTTAAAVIAAANPGVNQVLGVQSIAVAWGSVKPVLDYAPFSIVQAYLRSINTAPTNTPAVWSQYGQGTTGNVYLYPIPSQNASMEWDCYCQPVDLVDDTTVEAIPYPWTEAVPYYACYRAYLAAQRAPDSQMMLGEFKRKLVEMQSAATPPRIASMYSDG